MKKIGAFVLLLILLPITIEGMFPHKGKQKEGILGYWLFQIDTLLESWDKTPSMMPIVHKLAMDELSQGHQRSKNFCIVCRKNFATKFALRDHRFTKTHQDARLLYSVMRCSIEGCSFVAKTTKKLDAHSKKKHTTKWLCQICQDVMIFVSTEHKRQHCIEQHIKPSFGLCSNCGHTAAGRKEFYAHIINEHIVNETFEK